VGYALVAFTLIWLGRRPWLAATASGLALILGSLLGAGRIVAGDHFLSDVIWSGAIVYAVALGLYYFVLRIPQREAARALEPAEPSARLRYPGLALAGYSVLGAAILAAVLLATPVNQNETKRIRVGEVPAVPRTLRLIADDADVTLFPLTGDELVAAEVRLRARGFGLPGSRVELAREPGEGVVEYRVRHEGIFTERDTRILIGLVQDVWERVEVRTGKGDILVAPGPDLAPVLDLATADGQVLRP
jgi:hypothetical protein